MKIGTEGSVINVLGFEVSVFGQANDVSGINTPTGVINVKYDLGPTALVLFHIRQAYDELEALVDKMDHLGFYTELFESLEKNIPMFYEQPVHVEKVDFFQIGKRIPVTCSRTEGGGLHFNH